jgi:large subunit ribosomal protein L30
MSKIAITWKRSGIGYSRDQRRTIASLGLRRLHQTVVHDDTPSIKGMVAKVKHLVEVAEAPAKRPEGRTSTDETA